jgi:presenilin 1
MPHDGGGSDNAEIEMSSMGADSGVERDVPAAAEIEVANDPVELDEILHSINSFWVLVKPVAITMLIASWVVVNLTSAASSQQQAVYIIYKESGETGTESNGDLFAQAVANSLVIICAFIVITFGIVLCYKYNCTWVGDCGGTARVSYFHLVQFVNGYILFAVGILLGFMTFEVWLTAVRKYGFHWDVYSTVIVIWNFAIVGMVSIFYQKVGVELALRGGVTLGLL